MQGEGLETPEPQQTQLQSAKLPSRQAPSGASRGRRPQRPVTCEACLAVTAVLVCRVLPES